MWKEIKIRVKISEMESKRKYKRSTEQGGGSLKRETGLTDC